MATANGTLSPPAASNFSPPPSATKRKRSSSDTPIEVNGAFDKASAKEVNTSSQDVQQVLQDILTVLQSYDTQPSILNFAIPPSSAHSHTSERSTKRPKLAHDEDASMTISDRIHSGSYASLQELAEDTEIAGSGILASIKAKESSQGQVQTLDDTRVVTGVLAFQKILKNMISSEVQRMEPSSSTETDTAKDGEVDTKTSINNLSASSPSTVTPMDNQEGRTVLTLYGNAGAPKQLFSSLQKPAQIPALSDSTTDVAVKVTLPIQESTLPNIFSTTKIFPSNVEETDAGKKSGPTFGELFAPPASIPQLSPPKPAKQLTTRGTTISFVPQAPVSKPSRKGPYQYPTQGLSVGSWLGYNGVDAPKEPTSPTAKQKNRQRALSTGEAQLSPSEATLTALRQAKEDALFRGAYSSFAPCRDDAIAVVPEETKNRVWWQKVGEKRFSELFLIDPALEALQEDSITDQNNGFDEEAGFKQAAENFEPLNDDYAARLSAQSNIDKDTEDILQEISELLETLASHQRIRNSSLATNPRTPVIQNASLASLAGSPSSPSSEEIDVYQMLKSQLSILVASLPPYAVAKLNGDQLAELNISRTILVDTEDYRGVLEEDQMSRLAKQTALNAATGPGPAPAVRPGSQSHYSSNSQYPRPTPVAHPPPSRSSQGSQSYYSQPPTVHRSPSMHYPRSASGQIPQYQTPRSTYPQAQSYGQQTPRPAYSQGNSGQYYGQRSSQPNNYSMGGYYQTPNAQGQSQTRYSSQNQGSYQQRPPSAPMYNYNSAQSPHVRTGSPLKAGQPPVAQGQSLYNSGSRSAYGNSAPTAQLRSGSYFNQPTGQAPSQYGTPQPSTPSGLGPSGFHTSMSTEQQQNMMDRQRALAMQPQARMTSQGTPVRQGSGTPQPTNGQYGGQAQVNGTSRTT